VIFLYVVPALLLLAACGEDGEGDDGLFTGFSLVVILAIVGFLVWRGYRRSQRR